MKGLLILLGGWQEFHWSDDELPGSVHSEIAYTTYNLSPLSLTWTFSKPNITSPAQVESY